MLGFAKGAVSSLRPRLDRARRPELIGPDGGHAAPLLMAEGHADRLLDISVALEALFRRMLLLRLLARQKGHQAICRAADRGPFRLKPVFYAREQVLMNHDAPPPTSLARCAR